MEWIARLTDALGYVEDNLAGEIDTAHAARLAGSSEYHFTRMFSYISGVPLSEYIRRRRMTMAAFDLQTTQARVIDLALKYGYDSPTAFNRAFQSVHGISPTAAREQGAALKSYPRITFHIAIKGDVEMNYRIEHKEAFRIVGIKRSYRMDTEENFAQIPLLWGEAAQSGQIAQISALCDGSIPGLLGVSAGNFGDFGTPELLNSGKVFDYYIAATTKAPLPDGMAEYTVPAATWAIFEAAGQMPSVVQELQKRIITEWLPASAYEYGEAPDIEVYLSMPDEPVQRVEVWLPIVAKK